MNDLRISKILENRVSGSLIGRTIGGQLITKETRNMVWDGVFDCYNMGLTSLEGAPRQVKGYFNCSKNDLATLKDGPLKVENFACSNNKLLIDLDGAPEISKSFFNAQGCGLTSLRGAPKVIPTNFLASRNKIDSFEGAPEVVGKTLELSENKLVSLKDIHKHVKSANEIHLYGNPLKSNLLGILYIKNCEKVMFISKYRPSEWTTPEMRLAEKIINEHLPNLKGHKGVFECQCELQDANLDEYAQL